MQFNRISIRDGQNVSLQSIYSDRKSSPLKLHRGSKTKYATFNKVDAQRNVEVSLRKSAMLEKELYFVDVSIRDIVKEEDTGKGAETSGEEWSVGSSEDSSDGDVVSRRRDARRHKLRRSAPKYAPKYVAVAPAESNRPRASWGWPQRAAVGVASLNPPQD